jgi:hypothetical protein
LLTRLGRLWRRGGLRSYLMIMRRGSLIFYCWWWASGAFEVVI